jgi:hypothetical protein
MLAVFFEATNQIDNKLKIDRRIAGNRHKI